MIPRVKAASKTPNRPQVAADDRRVGPVSGTVVREFCAVYGQSLNGVTKSICPGWKRAGSGREDVVQIGLRTFLRPGQDRRVRTGRCRRDVGAALRDHAHPKVARQTRFHSAAETAGGIARCNPDRRFAKPPRGLVQEADQEPTPRRSGQEFADKFAPIDPGLDEERNGSWSITKLQQFTTKEIARLA